MDRRRFLGAVLGLLAAPMVALVPELKKPAKETIAVVDPLSFCTVRDLPLGHSPDGSFHFHADHDQGFRIRACFHGKAESSMALAC